MDFCFYCGEEITSDKCDFCQYEFSLDLNRCPRLVENTSVCADNRKVCREGRNWRFCKILAK